MAFWREDFFDAGILNDFVRGPAVSLNAGAADQIRIQFELGGIQRHMEDAVGQTKEFFAGGSYNPSIHLRLLVNPLDKLVFWNKNPCAVILM